jgi:hypothetical protein
MPKTARTVGAVVVILLLAGVLIAAGTTPVKSGNGYKSAPVNRRIDRKGATDAITIPQMINYQGKLTDASGNPITGTRNMTFTIHAESTGGSAVWTESQSNVPITSGLFNVKLGSVTRISAIPDGPDCFLEIVVEGATIAPRTRLATVPFAWNAAGLTSNQEGICRANAGNVLQGNNRQTHVNLGVACTTGTATYDDSGNTVSGGRQNYAGGRFGFATVGGGKRNVAQGEWGYSTVGGGYGNIADVGYATVGGGHVNTAGNEFATVGGGELNTASGSWATVGGGSENTAGWGWTTVGGGSGNTASVGGATVGGGEDNTASGPHGTVGGGSGNIAGAGAYSATVGGGGGNVASGEYATVGGGGINVASGDHATVGGGSFNSAGDTNATIAGGDSNIVSGMYATVGGGYRNRTDSGGGAFSATVAGGSANHAYNTYAAICGGNTNTANGALSFIGGGYHNAVTGSGSTVAGGEWNVAGTGLMSNVAGGLANRAIGFFSCVGGGNNNVALADGAMIVGGQQDTCAGTWGLAAGWKTIVAPGADYSLAFGENCRTTTPRAVVFYHSGGATKMGVGVMNPTHYIDVTGGSFCDATGWHNPSSRTLKHDVRNLTAREYQEILDLLGRTEVVRFRYNLQTDDQEHIGVIAEDAPALITNESRNAISTSDAIGFLLAAVKAEHSRNEDLARRLAALEAAQSRVQK